MIALQLYVWCANACLGLSEAEERRQLADLYAIVVELCKLLSRD